MWKIIYPTETRTRSFSRPVRKSRCTEKGTAMLRWHYNSGCMEPLLARVWAPKQYKFAERGGTEQGGVFPRRAAMLVWASWRQGCLRAPQSSSFMAANVTATRVMTHHYANERRRIRVRFRLGLQRMLMHGAEKKDQDAKRSRFNG
jgi:hypothetical protein